MKRVLSTVTATLFLLFSHSQQVGVETGIGVYSSNFALQKTIPVFVESPYIDIMKINRVVADANLQLPLISVYYKTLNHFKFSLFFQHHLVTSVRFLSDTYYFGLEPPLTSENSSTNYIDRIHDYTANDLGGGIEWFFRRNKPVHLSLNGRLSYKTRFKPKTENYGYVDDGLEKDFFELDKTFNSMGNFLVAGAGFGFHFKNLSWTWHFFQNVSKIEQSTEQYMDRFYGFSSSLTYGIDKELPIFQKRKKNLGTFSFSGSSKNNFFVEFSRNVYNKAVSEGESAVTYIRGYDEPSYTEDNNGMLHYTDTHTTNLPVYALLYFHEAPKAVSHLSLGIGLGHRLTEKFSLLFKAGEEVWRFKYDNLLKGDPFFDAYPDDTYDDFAVLNLTLSQGLKVNNLFSVKKNTAFCSVSVSEKFQLTIFSDLGKAIFNRMYISGSGEFGFNRFQNSLALGFERNITPLTTSAINYQVTGLYSGYVRLTHHF